MNVNDVSPVLPIELYHVILDYSMKDGKNPLELCVDSETRKTLLTCVIFPSLQIKMKGIVRFIENTLSQIIPVDSTCIAEKMNLILGKNFCQLERVAINGFRLYDIRFIKGETSNLLSTDGKELNHTKYKKLASTIACLFAINHLEIFNKHMSFRIRMGLWKLMTLEKITLKEDCNFLKNFVLELFKLHDVSLYDWNSVWFKRIWGAVLNSPPIYFEEFIQDVRALIIKILTNFPPDHVVEFFANSILPIREDLLVYVSTPIPQLISAPQSFNVEQHRIWREKLSIFNLKRVWVNVTDIKF